MSSSQEDYHLGMIGVGGFSLQEILNNIGTTWWCTILNRSSDADIHNTTDFGKKHFFQVFFIRFAIDFQTFIVHMKRLRSTFLRYMSRNYYLLPELIMVVFKFWTALKSIFNAFFVLKIFWIFVLNFWSCRKDGLIRKIRLISKVITAQPG